MSAVNLKIAQALFPLLTAALLATACNDSTAPSAGESSAGPFRPTGYSPAPGTLAQVDPNSASQAVASVPFPDTDVAILQVLGGYAKNTVTWQTPVKFIIKYYTKDTKADGKCAYVYARLRYADGTSFPASGWGGIASHVCGNGQFIESWSEWKISPKPVYQLQFKLVVGSAVDYYNVSPGGS